MKREVLAIINSAKIGMIFYMPVLPESIYILLELPKNRFSWSTSISYVLRTLIQVSYHSQSSKYSILDFRTFSLENRTKTYCISCGIIVKAKSASMILFIYHINFIISLLYYHINFIILLLYQLLSYVTTSNLE